MTDLETPEAPEVQDTPTEETPPETPVNETDTVEENADVDYFDEKFDPATLSDELRPGWKQIHGRYTQKFQELSEQRKELEENKLVLDALRSDDPEQQAAALRYLGYDIDDPEDGDDLEPDLDDEDNELAELRQQIHEMREWRESLTAQEQQAEYEQAIDAYCDEQLDDLKSSTGREFTDPEVRRLEKLAFASPNEDDLPDYKAAYEDLYGDFLPTQRTAWLETKRTDGQPGKGRAGTPQVDLSNDEERRAFMARAIESGASE
jgi:TolA-binding protein